MIDTVEALSLAVTVGLVWAGAHQSFACMKKALTAERNAWANAENAKQLLNLASEIASEWGDTRLHETKVMLYKTRYPQ